MKSLLRFFKKKSQKKQLEDINYYVKNDKLSAREVYCAWYWRYRFAQEENVIRSHFNNKLYLKYLDSRGLLD